MVFELEIFHEKGYIYASLLSDDAEDILRVVK